MDRRTFVKVAVGVGAAVGLGAGAVAVAPSLARLRGPPAGIRYFGARVVGGPAPRGVPYVPIAVKDGAFVGKPEIERGGSTWDTLAWLRYCAHGSAPGLQPAWTGDDALRYHLPADLRGAIRPWYADKEGERIRPEDFPGDGFGARFAWRSADPGSPVDAITGVIVKLAPGEVRFDTDATKAATPITDARERAIVTDQIMAGPFVAVSNWCTHFCCAAGFRKAEALARPRDAWDNVFCACHEANYDPRRPMAYTMLAE